jgi:hypothetical protein
MYKRGNYAIENNGTEHIDLSLWAILPMLSQAFPGLTVTIFDTVSSFQSAVWTGK